MGVAGEIAQYLLGSAERVFAIDNPFAVAQWSQIGGEGFAIGEAGMLGEKLQFTCSVSGDELLQEQAAEQG